jgi:SAM-dependent methyltransferase
MRADIDELRAFYATRQGQLARRLLGVQLRRLWPDLRGMVVVGVGYAPPLLGLFDDAARRAAIMPVGQGAARWPETGPSCVALAPEDELPLPDRSVDRLLLLHALETTPDLKALLREAWRVLADGGRILAIVPNRRGLWCWSDATPFGQGQPYSQGQLRRLLQHHLFEPTGERAALVLPPPLARWWPRLAPPAERTGLRLLPRLAGVLLVEAEKRVLIGAPVAVGRRARVRRYVGLPETALVPEPATRAGRLRGARAAAYARPRAPRSRRAPGPAP